MSDNTDSLWGGSMPAAYEKYLVPALFRPFAQDLAGRIAQAEPGRVLELAAGTGVLTLAMSVAVPGASVTATDLTPAMIAEGSSKAPGAKWQQADATALAFGDGEFDLVACQFGVMFFPDRPAAFSEARRVLSEGGRFVFNTWAPVSAHGFTVALVEVLDELLDGGSPPFITDVPHGYSDQDAIRADLAKGGFSEVTVEPVRLTGSSPSARDLALGYALGTPVRVDLEATGDPEGMANRIAAGLEARLGPGAITAEMDALVVTAGV
jgi:SAM-dependent methyltransferase